MSSACINAELAPKIIIRPLEPVVANQNCVAVIQFIGEKDHYQTVRYRFSLNEESTE